VDTNVLPPDGTYRYGQATIVVDGYWTQHRVEDYMAMSGAFPCIRVTVRCEEACSLLLEPTLHLLGESIVQSGVQGSPLRSELDLAPGDTRSIKWVFDVVAAGSSQATELEIRVQDRAGKADPGTALFQLEFSVSGDPLFPTTTPLP
jgi:hypothetical protein